MKRRVPGPYGLALAVLAILASANAFGQGSTQAEPATLVLWNRPIVTFRGTVGGVAPEQRASNARARIEALPTGATDEKIAVGQASIGSLEGLILSVGGHAVFGIVPADLDPESETTLEQAASAAASRLQELLAARAAQRDIPATLKGIGWSVLALLGFVFSVKLVLKIRQVTVGKLTAIFGDRRLSIGGIDIIPTLATVERATFRVLSWALILGLSYVFLMLVFHQFPLTVPLGQRLGDYLISHALGAGRAVILSLPSLLAAVGVLMITHALSLWVSRLLVEVEHGLREVAWLAKEQAKATRRIASGVVWVLGIATAYPLLPWSASLAFQGMSVILGLAVSFASGGLINHWVSGLVVLYARSFRVGEYVAVGETEGTVTEMGALATKLRTMRSEEISIPNGVLASQRLVNYSRLAAESGPLLSTTIAIGYETAWQRVQQLLLGAAVVTPGIAAVPRPRVLTWELSEFSVRYHLHTFLTDDADRIAARAELNTRILDAFAAAGVQIMTPRYEAQPEGRVLPLETLSGARHGA
jgi:small-conductance mechanosensitive channel